MFKLTNPCNIFREMASENYAIQPGNIDISHCDKLFYQNESKSQATKYLLIMFNQLGKWKAFKKKQIQKVYEKNHPGKMFLFCGLLNDKFILKDSHGYYYPTIKFVNFCYETHKGALLRDVRNRADNKIRAIIP